MKKHYKTLYTSWTIMISNICITYGSWDSFPGTLPGTFSGTFAYTDDIDFEHVLELSAGLP